MRELFWNGIREMEIYLIMLPMIGVSIIETDEESMEDYKYVYARNHIAAYRITKWVEKMKGKDEYIGR